MNVICNFIDFCADFPDRCETCPNNRLSKSFQTENVRERDFEAGIAFTIRHLTDNKRNSIDIGKFISDLSTLRMWKSESDWADLVKRNIVEDF